MIELPLEDARGWTPAQLLAQQARSCGDRTFLHHVPDGRTFSFRQADALTNALARAFVAAGIVPGSHVALMLDNAPEYVFSLLALGKVGAVAVPINTAARGELLRYYLGHADCTALILGEAFTESFAAIAAQLPLLEAVFVLGHAIESPGAMAGCRARVLPFPDPSRHDHGPFDSGAKFSDLALLLYTSGTTGPSKAVMMTHASVYFWASQRVNYTDYRAGDIDYVCMPLFHGNALLNSTLAALLAGTCVALTTRFSIKRFWNEVRASAATRFNAVGAIASFLWSQPPEPADRDHCVRLCIVAPTPAFAHGFSARFGIDMHTGYGISDYCAGTSCGPSDPPDKLFTAGRPRRGVHLRIVDDDDYDLPPGVAGEIVMRNESMWGAASGYYKMPQATLESRRNLWFHTGDRGFLDTEGYLHFTDRKKDAIRRRGENISASEVESLVALHPAVRQAAVYAVRSELTEDEVAASVVLHDGAALAHADLVEFCRRNMSHFMIPRYIEFVPELPLTLSQKVEKYRLRERAERDLSALWDREKAGIHVAPKRSS